MALHTLIDTTLMAWEPMPGIPGFKRRALHVDFRSGASIEIQYAPPGFSPSVLQRLDAGAIRHFHRTVTERHYFLSGDLPNCDWNDLDDMSGVLTTYRRHSFLDRPPLTLHGLLPGHVPAAGSEYLVWNTGSGTALWESDAARETVELADGDCDQWWGLTFTRPRILQADRLASAPHPLLPKWMRMVIAPRIRAPARTGSGVSAPPFARAGNRVATDSPAADWIAGDAGTGEVAIVIVPAGFATRGNLAALNAGAEATAWLFVVSGNLMLNIHTSNSREQLVLHEGGFLIFHGSRAARVRAQVVVSDRGCTLLTVGLDFVPSS